MKLSVAIDDFITDWRAQGRLTSAASERAYRDLLMLHAEDSGNRDPAYTGRLDVKRTLRRWSNPNTQANRRSILVSFYDWCMEEGHRPDNPARQTKRPRKKKSNVYRLTRHEVRKLLAAAEGRRERWAIYLMICAGLRSGELRQITAAHFMRRPGFIWVSPDIAKGGRERYVPIISDLEPIVAEIQEHVEPDAYVIPSQKVWNLQPERPPQDVPDQPASSQALQRLVHRVGRRAGIAAHIHPHLLRHAYGDHIAKYTGLQMARYLMGHSEVSTTQTYTGEPSLDELAEAVRGFTFDESHSNVRSRVWPEAAEWQEYRHGDSNPGSEPYAADTGDATDTHGNHDGSDSRQGGPQ